MRNKKTVRESFYNNHKILLFFITHNRGLFVLILLGMAIRLLYLCLDFGVSRDSVLYINIVNEMLQNETNWQQIYMYQKIPPFTLFLAYITSHCLRIDALAGGIIVNMISGLLIIPVIFQMGMLLSKKILFPYAAAILVTFSPPLIKLSTIFQRESAYCLLCGLTVLALIHWVQRPKIKYTFFCGVFSTLCFFSRFEGLEFLLIVPYVFCLIGKVKYQMALPRIAKNLMIYFITIAALSIFFDKEVFCSGFLNFKSILSHLLKHLYS